jgi:Fe-S-cluster containining protein
LEDYDVTGESQGGMARPGRGRPDPMPSDAAAALVPGRSCGTCSLCCKVNPVSELGKPAGRWCVHCVPGSGCAIHADRPRSCRAFFCAWRLDPSLGPEWKPEACRFVLSADPARAALLVMVDPGMPLAWKREPYYSRLQQFSEAAFRHDRKVLVNLRGNITVILPDREVPLGAIMPADEIVVWREGSVYGARLRRAPMPAEMLSKTSESPSAGRFESQSAAARGTAAGGAPAHDDPGLLDSVFKEAFEKTCQLIADPSIGDLAALTSIVLRGRNKVLDETAESYSRVAGAQCRAGCTSCCYLMVQGTPYEVLAIARHLLATKTPAEIESLKQRLQAVAEVPPDPVLRLEAKMPCALLEDGRCSVYEHRPSVCRMTLSQSRAACDSCLQKGSGSIPYIDQPGKIAAAMQMGIDHALRTRRNLATEGAELSRALLIALRDPEGTLTLWREGKDPFPGTHVGAPGAPPSHEKATAAARRLGLA